MTTVSSLDLDNDAFELASTYAGERGLPLGAAVSELIRRAEQNIPATPSNLVIGKHGWLVRAKSGRTITPETVKELSEDDAV